jgi:UDP:flavonoid glycosyltransferase YjiC (YdhE family)
LVTLSKINNPSAKKLKILVAPLDWGLGHATRCIPIIKELLKNRCEVWIAASGDQKTLLEEEFPLASFIEIPGYKIKYGKNRTSTLLLLIFAIPKILIRIKQEKAWLAAFQARENPDAVISDNRYGLHGPGLFSIFITHQLCIRTSFGRFADSFLQRINYRLISRFNRCWVPDGENEQSLAGDLSHPDKLPKIPVSYIGHLSRMEPIIEPINVPYSCDLLILLSGPEPQRTLFEQLILAQLPACSGNAILVRGLPREKIHPVVPGHVKIYGHLPARELNTVIAGAGIVISRAGYSTIMDLMKLGKKAILVPTPGQTEQEYLGKYLSAKKIAVSMDQAGFVLADALEKVRGFPFKSSRIADGPSHEFLEKAISILLEKLISST